MCDGDGARFASRRHTVPLVDSNLLYAVHALPLFPRYDFTDYEYFVKEDLDTKTLSESARVYAKAIAEGVDVVTATNRALAIINKIPTPAEASAWVEAYDVQLKKPYFFNKKTLKSQWERPPEMGFGVRNRQTKRR